VARADTIYRGLYLSRARALLGSAFAETEYRRLRRQALDAKVRPAPLSRAGGALLTSNESSAITGLRHWSLQKGVLPWRGY
jgi:hypothetical protein